MHSCKVYRTRFSSVVGLWFAKTPSGLVLTLISVRVAPFDARSRVLAFEHRDLFAQGENLQSRDRVGIGESYGCMSGAQ